MAKKAAKRAAKSAPRKAATRARRGTSAPPIPTGATLDVAAFKQHAHAAIDATTADTTLGQIKRGIVQAFRRSRG